jgi:uncharacterized protein involved in exopolysaccharide biosynthesis
MNPASSSRKPLKKKLLLFAATGLALCMGIYAAAHLYREAANKATCEVNQSTLNKSVHAYI